MKVKVKRIISEDLQLPHVAYATLLTPDELEEYQEFVPSPLPHYEKENWTSAWYLRDEIPLDNGEVTYASGTGVYDTTPPDWDDPGEDDDDDETSFGTGTRPVLVFEKSLFEAGFKQGDNFGDWADSFTVISEFMALSDRYISVDVFDDSSNDYENSAIKERVNEWFENVFSSRIWCRLMPKERWS